MLDIERMRKLLGDHLAAKDEGDTDKIDATRIALARLASAFKEEAESAGIERGRQCRGR